MPLSPTRGKSAITVSRETARVASLRRTKSDARELTSVKRSVSTGRFSCKQLVSYADKVRSVPNGDATMVKKFGKSATKHLPANYHVARELGSGAFGTAYLICENRFRCSVLKLQKVQPSTEAKTAAQKQKSLQEQKQRLVNEGRVQEVFALHDLAPGLSTATQFYHEGKQEYAALVMTQVDGTFDRLLRGRWDAKTQDQMLTSLLTLLGSLEKFKLTHGDMQPGNIAFRYFLDADGRLSMQFLFIDFGFSVVGESNCKLELLQLVRFLVDKDFKKSYDKDNVAFLLKQFAPMLKAAGVATLDPGQLEDLYFDERQRFLAKHGITDAS